jgi:multimeric flavodoxin WrbA
MKILAINGSHRKGNTEAILKKILDGASSKGAQVELVNLRERNVENCKACSGCEDEGTCNIGDEFPHIFEKLVNADLVVLGSPNYFNNVSALMKGFIDRMNAHWEDPRLEGKKAVLVMPGGYSASSIEKGLQAFREFPKICKMRVVEEYAPLVDKPQEAGENAAIMQECLELGKRIVA